MASSSSSSSTTTSSFSTLSAKARPFVPPQPRPPPSLPSSSQSTLSAKAPPFAKPSSDPASKINPLIGTPYYPSYDGFFDSELLGFGGFPSSTYNGDDVLESSWDLEDFHGVTMGPWNAPFDGKEVWQLEESDASSLWRIPSLDHGVRPKVTAPHKISVASKSALSSQISGASTSAVSPQISGACTSAVSSQISGASSCVVSSQLSISSPPMESCNAFQSKSFSDCYTGKVYTCSTNPVANYPVSGHSTPAPGYDPSSQETSSIADSVSKSVDSTRAVPEESSTSKVKGEEGFDGRRTANNNINTDTDIDGDSSIMTKGMSSSSGYETSLTSPIKLTKTLSSRSDSAKQDKSLRNSSETLENLDSDVDSPCWRGTLAYQQSPFHVDEAITPHLAAVTSISDTEVAESQPYIPTTSGYAKTIHYLENSENLISYGTKSISSISHSEKSLDVAFSSMQKRSEYPYIIESERNCKGIPFIVNSKVERTDMTKDKQRKSESQDKEVLQLDQEVTATSANQPRTADDITVPESYLKDTVQNSAASNQCYAVDATTSITVESHDSAVLSGKPSFAREYTQLIDETLQCLRKKLLSHAYKDENALKELLNDVLLLVNDYPEAFVLNNKMGITNGCCIDSGQVADQSQRGLKGHDQALISQSSINNIEDILGEDDAILYQSNIKTCHDTGVQEKMLPIGLHTTHRQGIAQGNSHDCIWEFVQSQIIGLQGDAFRQSNITISHDMTGKFAHSIGASMSDKIDNLPSDLSIIEGMANDFKKILNKTFCEREENLRTVLHKNLWIEAQAKLFSMKYELQLARTEIEILKHNLCAKGSLQDATGLSSLNSSWQNSQPSKPSIYVGESSQKFRQDMNKREKDDPSLMAGLGVLEGHVSVGQICRQDAERVFAKWLPGGRMSIPKVDHDDQFFS